MNLIFDCVKDKPAEQVIPKQYHAITRILNKDSPTYGDLKMFRDRIHYMIHNEDYSPKEIQSRLDIQYSDFGMFIKKCLGIQLKSCKEANISYAVKSGKRVSSEKHEYYKSCAFKFDPYGYPDIPGYSLLLEYGIYHPQKNPNGVCRDHMISKEYGWRNKISADLISSPHNCQFLSNLDNVKKNSACSITTEDLLDRISNGDFSKLKNSFKQLPKTAEHKLKISNTVSKYMCVTNGMMNLKILKTDSIPDGFRRGMTRKHKMVGEVGIEPTR